MKNFILNVGIKKLRYFVSAYKCILLYDVDVSTKRCGIYPLINKQHSQITTILRNICYILLVKFNFVKNCV